MKPIIRAPKNDRADVNRADNATDNCHEQRFSPESGWAGQEGSYGTSLPKWDLATCPISSIIGTWGCISEHYLQGNLQNAGILGGEDFSEVDNVVTCHDWGI